VLTGRLHILFPALLVLLITASKGIAQTGDRPGKGLDVNPCPGGGGTAEIDTITVPSLDRLALMSDLIVTGNVVSAFPAINIDAGHAELIETDSLVSVTETLWGTLPSNGHTILLFQLGGKAGPCTTVVPDDPLIKPGEQYVLFLRLDKRKDIPNTSGAQRYSPVGVWSGKAKVASRKIQFPLRAHAALHQYDNTDAAVFLQILKQRIAFLSAGKLMRIAPP